MNEDFFVLALGVMGVALAFNVVVTLRLAAIVGHREYQQLPEMLRAGTALPRFSGRTLGGERVGERDVSSEPSVLVFLSPDCADCRAKLPEIERLLPEAKRAGVSVWIVGLAGKRRLREYFSTSPLFSRVLVLGDRARRRLNPRNTSPAYLFVNNRGLVEAGNFIGDENWLAFRQQLEGSNEQELAAQ